MGRMEDAILRVYEVLKDNNVPSKAAHQVVSTILDNGFKIEYPNSIMVGIDKSLWPKLTYDRGIPKTPKVSWWEPTDLEKELLTEAMICIDWTPPRVRPRPVATNEGSNSSGRV